VDGSQPQQLPAIRQRLEGWKRDPDLATVLNANALASLPDEERTQWQQLWSEVNALIEKLNAATK